MAGNKTSGTLSGFAIIGSPSWTFTTGVSPNQQVFEVVRKDANRFMQQFAGKGKTVELRIKPEGPSAAGELVVKGLIVIDTVPTGRPHTVGILVADRRWNWTRRNVFRRYNIRRRTGNRRMLSDDALGAISASVLDIGFAKWSLKDNTSIWTASQILRDVMERIDPTGEMVIRTDINFWDAAQVTDLELDDAGPSALSRVLSNMRGVQLWIDKDGKIIFQSELDGTEKALLGIDADRVIKVDTFRPAIVVGRGSPEWVDHRVQRPEKCIVYLNREIEVRFDRSEGLAVTQAIGATGADFLENVLPSPDLTLTVDGRTVVRGTYITVEDALAAWAPTTLNGLTPLTLDRFLSTWYADLTHYYCLDSAGFLDPVWTARIQMLKQHFRRTYRIPREWMDRIYQIKAYRLSVWDDETGQRAPSPVWMDYTLKFNTMRPLFADAGGGSVQVTLPYDLGVRGYANRLTNGNAAPVHLDVVDEELGIIAISFRGDPLEAVADLYPGILIRNAQGDIATAAAPRFRTEKLPDGNSVAMDDRFGLATILTVAFGAPNDESQFQAIEVTAEEAQAKINDAHFLPAVGPPMDLRIRPQLMTARFAWRDVDGMGRRVRQAVGVDRAGTTAGGFSLVNEWINKDDCKEVAVAFAAAYYAGLQDRAAGTRTMGLSPGMGPMGAVTSVEHSIDPSGAGLTAVTGPAYVGTQVDPMSLLPPSVRRSILREVIP